MPLESTRTRQRVSVARRVLCRTAVRTLLTRPRLRSDLDRHPVLLGRTRQSIHERSERPEVVRLRVRLNRPVRVKDIRQRPDVHHRDAFVVESFDEITSECVLSVVTALGASVVEASDAVTAVSTILQERLEAGDFSCRLAESVEQLTPFVQELLAGCGCAGDEVVRTNIQSGLFRSQWVCQSRIIDGDWLKGPECLRLLVVKQL